MIINLITEFYVYKTIGLFDYERNVNMYLISFNDTGKFAWIFYNNQDLIKSYPSATIRSIYKEAAWSWRVFLPLFGLFIRTFKLLPSDT